MTKGGGGGQKFRKIDDELGDDLVTLNLCIHNYFSEVHQIGFWVSKLCQNSKQFFEKHVELTDYLAYFRLGLICIFSAWFS